MPKIEIVEIKSGKVLDTVETNHAQGGVVYEKFIAGLERKVDLDRFFIRESDDPLPKSSRKV